MVCDTWVTHTQQCRLLHAIHTARAIRDHGEKSRRAGRHGRMYRLMSALARPHESSARLGQAFVICVDTLGAYPGKVDTDIGFTRYRHIKVRKSETSDLRGFPKRICANV